MIDRNKEGAADMAVEVRNIRSVQYTPTAPEDQIDLEKCKQILATLSEAKQLPADNKIILDFRRSRCKLSTTNLWYLAAELEKYAHTFCRKFAVLIQPDSSFKNADFFELCSKNRGFNIGVFTNYEDAIQWFYEDRECVAGSDRSEIEKAVRHDEREMSV